VSRRRGGQAGDGQQEARGTEWRSGHPPGGSSCATQSLIGALGVTGGLWTTPRAGAAQSPLLARRCPSGGHPGRERTHGDRHARRADQHLVHARHRPGRRRLGQLARPGRAGRLALPTHPAGGEPGGRACGGFLRLAADRPFPQRRPASTRDPGGPDVPLRHAVPNGAAAPGAGDLPRQASPGLVRRSAHSAGSHRRAGDPGHLASGGARRSRRDPPLRRVGVVQPSPSTAPAPTRMRCRSRCVGPRPAHSSPTGRCRATCSRSATGSGAE